MSEDAVTGVHSHNDVEGYFFQETTIDLAFEQWKDRVDDFLGTDKGQELLEKHGYESEDRPDGDDNEFWDDVVEEKSLEYAPPRVSAPQSGRELIGDWKKVDGKYEADRDGANGYSAIHNRRKGTIQVVYSEYKIKCARTSPCYPNQGDVGTPPNTGYGEKIAYVLPPELLRDDYLDEMGEHIIEDD